MSRTSFDFTVLNPEPLEPGLGQGLALLEKEAVVRRIWQRDHTVWKPEDREISDRLGWLLAPETAVESIPALNVGCG